LGSPRTLHKKNQLHAMPEAMREAGSENRIKQFDRGAGSGIDCGIRRRKLAGNAGTQGRDHEDGHAEHNPEKNSVLDECRAFLVSAERLHRVEQLTHNIYLRLSHYFSKTR
jgi:hypothetical protein